MNFSQLSVINHTLASIVLIASIIWGIILCSETTFEIIKKIIQRKPIIIHPLLVSNLSLTIIVIFVSLLSSYTLIPNSPIKTSPVNSNTNNISATSAPSPITPIMATALKTPLPITLNCDCSDPIVVTVTQVQIQSKQKRMLWSLSLYNNSQNDFYTSFDSFSLHGVQIYDPTGQFIRGDLQYLRTNETKTTTLTFSFVPYTDKIYTLYSANEINGSFNSVVFDPVIVHFK